MAIITKEQFESAIKNPNIQVRINGILEKTGQEITGILVNNKYSATDIANLSSAIKNNRKTTNRGVNNGLAPSGNISLKKGVSEYEIPVDTVLKKFPYLSELYKDASNSSEDSKGLDYVDNLLIACILEVIDGINPKGGNDQGHKEKEKNDKEKEKNDKDSINVTLATFTEAYPEDFIEYCKKNNITREDGKSIDKKQGLDPYAIYIKDGKKFRLIYQNGGADIFGKLGDYGDYPLATEYKLVAVEDNKKNEIEKLKEDNVKNTVLATFTDAYTKGFQDYCNEHNIVREDGKSIEGGYLDVDATYISQDGKKLKLIRKNGGADISGKLGDYGDYPLATEYDLVIIEDNGKKGENVKEKERNKEKNNDAAKKIAFNKYFEEHKREILGVIIWIDGIRYKAIHLNKDGAVQFKQVDGKDHFAISSFQQLKEKGQINGFDDGLINDGQPRKGSESLTRTERERHELIRILILGEAEYLKNGDNDNKETKNKNKETGDNDESIKISPDELVKLNAVISDVTDYYIDKIENDVANELNAEWQKLNQGGRLRRNFNFGKIRLFFTRGRKKKKREKEMRESYSGFAFTGNEALDKELSKQASRHDYEEGLGMSRHAFGKIERESLDVPEKFKEMCESYIAGTVDKNEFQDWFNKFVENHFNLPEGEKGEQFIATNILDKLDAIREDNKLLDLIIKDLEGYLSDRNKSHFDSIKKLMDVYFEGYKRDPRFRSKILDLLGTDKKQIVLYNFTDSAKGYDFAKYCKENGITRANGQPIDGSKGVDTDAIYRSKDGKRLKIIPKKGATNSIENVGDFDERGGVTEYELVYDVLGEKIERFIKHEKALAKMSTNNLKVKLDLLSNGKGAHQINDEDHKKGRLFRNSKKFDELPWYKQALSIAGVSVVAGTGVGLLGGSAAVATAVSSAVIGGANFLKKIKHYTDEQKKVEGDIARDSRVVKVINGSKQRYEAGKKNFGLEELKKGYRSRFKRYKDRKHRKKYGETSHSKLLDEQKGNTRDISEIIYNKLNHYNELSENEQIMINGLLLDSLARLQTYRNTGHNFLKGNNRKETETDFYNLENSLDMCAKRIFNNKNATIEDLTRLVTKDRNGKDMTYEDILDFYNKDYETASKKFDDERKRLAALWGFKTAIISFGISAGFQFLFGRGMFADHDKGTTANLDNSNNTDVTDAVRDYYELGKYHVTGSKTFELAQNKISTLPSSDTVTLEFWAGTNPVPLSPDSYLHTPGLFTAKLNHVIQIVQNSHLSNIDELVGQLKNLQFPTNDATGQAFLSYDLHAMRCLDVIENAVKGSQDFSGALKIDPVRGSSTANDLIGGAQFMIQHANVADSAGSAAHSWTEKIIIPGLWVSNEFENPTQGIDEVQGSLEQDPLNQQDLGKKLAWYDTTNDELKEDEVIDEPQVEQIDESELGEVNNQYKRNSSGQQLRNAA